MAHPHGAYILETKNKLINKMINYSVINNNYHTLKFLHNKRYEGT